jgi:hypothetical protein
MGKRFARRASIGKRIIRLKKNPVVGIYLEKTGSGVWRIRTDVASGEDQRNKWCKWIE